MHRYRLPLALMVVVGLVLCGMRPLAAQSRDGFFPYEIHKRTLENGLDVIVIPMLEFENVLSYNTLILAGARNETEPGKSGLAHLFEHIQFRHMWQGKPQGYEEAMSRMGAFNNAWTWFDVTFYHPVTFASNLNQLAILEADRFTSLKFTEEVFVTEAGTVLGEYRNSAADPGMRMDEVQLAEMYGSHGYGHTTMGYLEDVEDLPNEFKAAIGFYNTYYRPNNVVMVIAGDVGEDPAVELTAEGPALVKTVGAHLHRGHLHAPVDHVGKYTLKIDRLRRSVFRWQKLLSDLCAQRPDQPGLPA